MACVVAVQALVFQDGGLVVMGANIFNMGIIGTLGGYAVYAALCRLLGGEERGRMPGGRRSPPGSRSSPAPRRWRSSSACRGTTALGIALPAMVGVHVLIGIGEALITWPRSPSSR